MNKRTIRRAIILGAYGVCTLGLLARCMRSDDPTATGGGHAGGSGAAGAGGGGQPKVAVVDEWAGFNKSVQPFLTQNCVSCHGDTDPEMGVRLNKFSDAAELDKHGHVLTRALKMIRTHKMPPSDEKQPTVEELKPVVAWLEQFAARVDAEDMKYPGHVTMRRLNRTEYNRTIHDLLGIDFKPADSFPEDDAGYGFDNNGDVLTLAPILMDKYLAAAETALNLAINVEPASPPVVKSWDAGQLEGTVPKAAPAATQGARGGGFGGGFGGAARGRPFAYNGDISTDYEFPKNGHYVLRVKAYGATGNDRSRPQIVFKLDGKPVDKPVTVTADLQGAANFGIAQPLEVSAGKHTVTVSFVNGASKDEYDAAEKAAAATAPATAPAPATQAGGRGNRGGGGFGGAGGRGGRGGPAPSLTGRPTLGILQVDAEGPVDLTLDRMPASFRKVFVAMPSDLVSKQEAARRIIATFATRAYRRPVTDDELKKLMAYWTEIDKSGEEFPRGISLALQPVLVSPKFLYRVEGEPTAGEPVRALNEYELASRLSYFLWSSMPDEELIRLAGEGKLRANLDQQVDRMLADPRSSALGENFAVQWLELRKLPAAAPDAKLYPNFDEALRTAMLKETELFFNDVKSEDLSVLTFLDADFTFVNQRLAKHYGIPGVTGDNFRRVSLAGTQRGGLITQASVLTLTSFPTRTSPVNRGKWVLENLLDAAPPPPPPNVPKLEDHKEATEGKLSLRQQMEAHRANPTCYSCHAVMDPIGFGLEGFDAIGSWHEKDANNEKIDVSGKLPDGKTFEGAEGLKEFLLSRKDEFCDALVTKMMTYALGRGMEEGDRPRIKLISEALKKENYKFSALVINIVKSDAFQKQGIKRGEE